MSDEWDDDAPSGAAPGGAKRDAERTGSAKTGDFRKKGRGSERSQGGSHGRGPRGRSDGRGPGRPGRGRDEHRPAAPLLPIQQRLVLGQNCVREAIAVWGNRIDKIYVEADPNPRLAALSNFARDHGVTLETTTRASLERLAGGSLHQGVAASVPELELVKWESLRDETGLLAIALDGVVDPQNFGAVIRSAVGIAGAPIIWAESASAPLTPATFRASAGAIEHARLCRVPSLHGALSEAAAHGITVLGLAPEAELSLAQDVPTGPTILVIGSEQKGMGKAVRKACTRLVRLHQSGLVQSLNASVAAGISLHHLATARH